MSKNVLLVSYSINPEGGSEPKAAWTWLEGLLNSEYSVSLITSSKSLQFLKSKNQLVQSDTCSIYVVHSPSIPNIFYPLNLYIEYLIWQYRAVKQLRKMPLDNFDFGHHSNWGNLLLGTPLSKTRLPYIFGPGAGNTSDNPLVPKNFNDTIISYARKCLVKIILEVPYFKNSLGKSAIAVCSNSEVESLVSKTFPNLKTKCFLPDSIEDGLVRSSIAYPKSQSIIWVGRFIKRKNPILAVLAFQKVLEVMPNAKLQMYGNGPLKHRTQRLVEKLGLNESIKINDRIPWSDLIISYDNAKLNLFTSSRDAFGAQILEASARGVPSIVLSGMPLLEWIDIKEMLIVHPSDGNNRAEGFAKLILKGLNMDRRTWRELSQGHLDFAHEHKSSVKQFYMQQIYDSIFEKSK
jgi:glycosyltransferase involved in cell wall biosynthesis